MDIRKLVIAIISCLSIISCSKDIETIDPNGTVCGVVSDLETGEPISNVSVALYEGLAWDSLGAGAGNSVTGTDGFFQIIDIDTTWSHFIIFKHSGYETVG
ncbi:MAG: carboxypeptidase-like regulatory domain-containing protein, partial [Muribaculaceae bacterium]|nr:carboxypeptidase-like regulatory domain-containing protein [Muribaculaceae bacterium]